MRTAIAPSTSTSSLSTGSDEKEPVEMSPYRRDPLYRAIIGHASAGAVNVIYGGPDVLYATAGPGAQFFTQANINPPVSVAKAGNRFGAALAVGDFDGDDYDDLAIGIPGDAVEGTITGA